MNEIELSLIIAFSAVLVSIIGVVLSDKRTRDSNLLTRKELNARLRPWLKIEGLIPGQVLLENGNIVNFDTYNENIEKYEGNHVKIVKFFLKLVNIGTMPALEIEGKSLQQWNEITKECLTEGRDLIKTQLMPGEHLEYNFDIPIDDYLKLETTLYYVGIQFKFSVNEKNQETVGKIFVIKRGFTTVQDSWMK